MTEQLAIIKNAHRRVEDHCGKTAIVFDAYITEGSAASQWVIPGTELFELVWEALDKDGTVASLNGRACWVAVDTHTIHFLRMAKL